MAIHIVRLGSARLEDEGLRFGTVRHPPRGVPTRDVAARDFFDVWLPELAPSAVLVSRARAAGDSEARWRQFVRAYRREMSAPPARHLIAALAALSHQTNFSVGCYCEDVTRCHRGVLAELLTTAGARVLTG